MHHRIDPPSPSAQDPEHGRESPRPAALATLSDEQLALAEGGAGTVEYVILFYEG